MIAECIEEKKPFGVVRASAEGVDEIGCTAEILSVIKKYDDGRMDILTHGVQRFELLAVMAIGSVSLVTYRRHRGVPSLTW